MVRAGIGLTRRCLVKRWEPVGAADVQGLVDLTVEGSEETASMATLQYEGIAALHQILSRGPAAYLADEVGMGKTYQAMGLAAVVWNDHPDARILFVSPRENLQFKWLADYRRFFASNYRRPYGLGDDLVASVLFRRPVHRAVKFDRLRDWTQSLASREPVAAFVRHTSFARPVHLRAAEYGGVEQYWDAVTRYCQRAGLHEIGSPEDVLGASVTEENVGYAANLAFARAANRRLGALHGGGPYFDLVVLDEAQCLRNPGNQTNTLLHELLGGQVERWLFMSATPAHAGPRDITTVLNHYPGAGQLVDPELTTDLPRLQRALEGLMVRRSRRYVARTGDQLTKSEYRRHDRDTWGVTDEQIGALSTLGMGLVQKGLVEVLGQRGNRFKIGFLSSFESLQSSVRGQLDRDEQVGDWHVDSGGGTDDHEAPDDDLIDQLVGGFRTRFGTDLPHPKLDAVASRLGQLAYGTDTDPGGDKALVFTRRVSTVAALRSRMTAYHRRRVEARLERLWGRPAFNWTDPGVEPEPDAPALDEDPEAVDNSDDDADLIRAVMQDTQWLGRYRRTFRATGRNALFFEDGWLLRLCRAGGVAPEEVAEAIPDRLWAEAWQHASRPSGQAQSRYQADRLRYLAWHALDRHASAFGLDDNAARSWRSAYEAALHEHLAPEELDGPLRPEDVHRDSSLVTHGGLWAQWDDRLAPFEIDLPASDPSTATRDTLLQRQVARTVLGQAFRLSDTLVDLWAADQRGGEDMSALADHFLAWLESDDPCARRLRRDTDHWLTHLRTIVDSSLDGSGQTWAELAHRETWPQLYELAPVLGVTGGSGAQQRATQQFRTPGMPRVIVCTDTLKEGVDLHLFCDHVVHYGVAWTPGDQEQRVGRVDRYFSQIERRIRNAPPGDAHLEVGYPHVVRTIERRQVERVMERQQQAEKLMDSPLAGHGDDDKEFEIDAFRPRTTNAVLDPFSPPHVNVPRRTISKVTAEQAEQVAEHYSRWHASLLDAVAQRGGRLAPAGPKPTETQTLTLASHHHDIEWAFDGAVKRYVLTVSEPLREESEEFSGGWRRRLRERRYVDERFLSVLVPTEEDLSDATLPGRVIDAVEGMPPTPDDLARATWHESLDATATGPAEWHAPHKVRLTVECGPVRRHTVSLYAYRGEVRILGTAASHNDLASHLDVEPDDRHSMLRWARQRTADLDLGYVDVHDRDGLVFGLHVIHGGLSDALRADLVREVAWRADALESIVTGDDRW